MAKRTYESPMDWEYQDTAPMDPSSPFAQSTKQAKDKNIFGGSSNFSTFGQNAFTRTQSTPLKPLPLTPMQQQQQLQQQQQQSPSIFRSSRAQRSTTAPSFRNPAFTTPRRPFDMDVLSEASPAESSPAATDGSDFPETPDRDQSFDMGHMTITPATMNRHKSLFPKKASGKGEICKPIFPSRDKIRKRKRYNGDKDISGYRLPYRHSGEGDDSEYESDESTFQPNKPQDSQKKKRSKDGWFGNFLATLQRHPYAPSILGYWLNFGFSLVCVAGTLWIGWAIVAGLREDFAAARSSVRDEILDEMAKCRSDYIDNKCSPVEKRLPAMFQLCEQWNTCMNKNPDHLKRIQLGAKNIVEIINEIVDTMSYKTIALLVLLFAIFLFSGRSLYKSAHDYPDFTRHAPPSYGQSHPSEHAGSQQVYWHAIQPQTPRRNLRHLPPNDETPDTDASPPKFQMLLPPETPSGRRSPTKIERGRSPMKSRSPTKHY
ncbi:putative nuclear envelope protein [Rosellinia necatrix]|uniref:Putative nuclear envelope protein n=1 Tax=Rosellinia necatrix TaxID=77044 RepID=A0A1W2TF48_ROSNE|nr:putative nuclear envelope protein [Rosellinia necatrix]